MFRREGENAAKSCYSRPSREGYRSERSSEGKESGAIKNRGGGEGGRERGFFSKRGEIILHARALP